jgi:hypothetical protein
MPVDKFGHTDSGSTQRVIAGGVTESQVNSTFLRLDGANPATGDLNMSGHTIRGLPTTNTANTANTPEAGIDEAMSRGQVIDLLQNHDDVPTDNNHLTNKKYVDEQLTSKVAAVVGPAVSAYSSTQQAIIARTHTAVTFDVIRCGTARHGIEQGIGTTSFFPSKAGYYIVSAYIEFCNNSNTAYGTVHLYKNGASYMQIAGGGSTKGSQNHSIGSNIVFLDEFDYVNIHAFSSIATNILCRDFSAAFLRP